MPKFLDTNAPAVVAPAVPGRQLHPKMAIRGKAIAAAHAHLAKTVKGWKSLTARERFKRAAAHVATAPAGY